MSSLPELRRTLFISTVLTQLAICGTASAGFIPPSEQPSTEQLTNLSQARVVSEESPAPSESGTQEAGDPPAGNPADVAVKMKY